MSTAVLIPWRPGCPHRAAALDHVAARYAQNFDVAIGRCPQGPWIKALAVADALRQTNAEVLIVADGDVWAQGLPRALQAVCDGARWAIPHRGVLRLTGSATARYLGAPGNRRPQGPAVPVRPADFTTNDTGRPARDARCGGRPLWSDPIGTEVRPHRTDSSSYDEHAFGASDLIEPAYLGVEGGGIVVLRRETYAECPLDPRFVGWGGEDESWGFALRALYGPPVRVRKPVIHLWHPPANRMTRGYGSLASRELRKRYARARASPALMRALLAEAAQQPVT